MKLYAIEGDPKRVAELYPDGEIAVLLTLADMLVIKAAVDVCQYHLSGSSLEINNAFGQELSDLLLHATKVAAGGIAHGSPN